MDMKICLIGPALLLMLGCLGSIIGCGIAGMASHGVMSRVEEDHGKFIGLSALPSSQAMYSFVLMILMLPSIKSGALTVASSIGIGGSIGVAIMVSAIYQGKCAATAIYAMAKDSKIYGKCLAALGIVEAFALFAFVFSIFLLKAAAGGVEKIAFLDATGLYALNHQQEALNCILFYFQ